ncbi:MAG: hypothetical protein ABI462_07735 [Ignavibacteria bacterium]
MRENIKTDYLKYLFHRTLADLSRFNINRQDSELINKLFNKLSHSENILIELYMLSNVRNFRSIGNYLVFIYKKMEDNVINFDNLSQNLNTDSEFIENEILNYLSNPKLTGKVDSFKDEEKIDHKDVRDSQSAKEEEPVSTHELTDVVDEEIEEDDDILKFKKNYLELIQSEDDNSEIVFDLPTVQKQDEEIIPGTVFPEETEDEQAMELPVSSGIDQEEVNSGEGVIDIEENDDAELFIKEETTDQTDFELKNDPEDSEEIIIIGKEDEIEIVNTEETTDRDVQQETEVQDKIPFSEEIQEELNLFKESEDNIEEADDTVEEILAELPPTNESFIGYENEIMDRNIILNHELDKMTEFIISRNTDEEERIQIINNIMDTAAYLENISRKMSLEIISNIYQTITLSFEKISDGKYDLSESTLNLFKNGLSLVLSLIKGDDYFGYKDILKSIENIRNSLIEEKERREKYLKRLKEKLDDENNLRSNYPDNSRHEKRKLLKKLIKDSESNFNQLDKITGEYQIYEALRSLSGNLNNFKDIVKLSKDLEMKKLVQLAEASYIFTKFLQNYRINPVTTETKEIFGYIIYNLKLLAMEKPAEDINLFISYLNDPVKIFSKPELKNK